MVTTVDSPCVRNCCLNDADICVGCFRSLDEIIQWSGASDAIKIQILNQAEGRRLQSKPEPQVE